MIGTNYFGDPNDNSDQYAIDARDLYQAQAQQQYYQQQPSGYFYPNYNMPQQNYYNPGMQQSIQSNLMYMQPQQQQSYYPTTDMSMQQQGGGIGYNQQPQYQQGPGYVGNPAFQFIQNNNYRPQRWGYNAQNRYGSNPYYFQYQQPQYQDKVVHVPGYNPTGSDYIFTSDAQDQLDQMQVDMMFDMDKAIAKHAERTQGYFNSNMYGYNYYGVPYYTSYYDQSVINKYNQKVEKLKQEALDRKLSFNKNLSKLAHNWLNDGVTDEEIDRRYEGYDYTIPGAKLQNDAQQDMLDRLVPVNSAAWYQEQDRLVSEEFRKLSPAGRNMNEFFEDCGYIRSMDNLEEEYHRRKDNKGLYDTDFFHMTMRKYAAQHDIDDRQVDYSTQSKRDIMTKIFGKDQVEDMERRGVSIGGDHTINVSAPEEMKRRLDPQYGQYHNDPHFTGMNPPEPDQVLTNELENDYNYQRNRFIQSIMRSDKDNRSATGG